MKARKADDELVSASELLEVFKDELPDLSDVEIEALVRRFVGEVPPTIVTDRPEAERRPRRRTKGSI